LTVPRPVDREALPKLTAKDLKDLGVVLGGHRRKLLDAIAALGAAVPECLYEPALAGLYWRGRLELRDPRPYSDPTLEPIGAKVLPTRRKEQVLTGAAA
jgi:hypothetical protein